MRCSTGTPWWSPVFSVHVYGVDHALIHQDIPLVVNTGFLVEGEVFHPGDSYTIPEIWSTPSWSRSAPPGSRQGR